MKSIRVLLIFTLALFIVKIIDALPVEYELPENFVETSTNEIEQFEQDPHSNYVHDHQNLWPSEALEDEGEDLSEIDHPLRQKRAQRWFNGRKDTSSKSAREAFRNAKDQNGIPRNETPLKQYYVPDKHNPKKKLIQYDFKNSFGQYITIRKDLPIKFKDGGQQTAHYNAGPTGGKLPQHHYFPSRKG